MGALIKAIAIVAGGVIITALLILILLGLLAWLGDPTGGFVWFGLIAVGLVGVIWWAESN